MTASPVAVIPVGLLEIKWMGLWPSSAMIVVVVVAWVVVAAVAPSLGCDLRSLLPRSYLVGLFVNDPVVSTSVGGTIMIV